VLLGSVAFWIILFLFATPSVPGWATRFWLPTLFSENLSISMEQAGPLATILIAGASFIGVIFGGILSDKWVLKNLRGRIYTSAIGLSLMVPALLLLGFGDNLLMIIGGGLCFGIGYGMFDANNMPILCQFFGSKYRATAYGIMNMTGVFLGAAITQVLGNSVEAGSLGRDFAMLSGVVVFALVLMISFLYPKTVDMNENLKN
jgi:Major Facilitator Superfamily.